MSDRRDPVLTFPRLWRCLRQAGNWIRNAMRRSCLWGNWHSMAGFGRSKRCCLWPCWPAGSDVKPCSFHRRGRDSYFPSQRCRVLSMSFHAGGYHESHPRWRHAGSEPIHIVRDSALFGKNIRAFSGSGGHAGEGSRNSF